MRAPKKSGTILVAALVMVAFAASGAEGMQPSATIGARATISFWIRPYRWHRNGEGQETVRYTPIEIPERAAVALCDSHSRTMRLLGTTCLGQPMAVGARG